MQTPSLEDYWELLENHDWFYPWALDYEALLAESKALENLSKLSSKHSELYATYYRTMYRNMVLENDDVMNSFQPSADKPEAA